MKQTLQLKLTQHLTLTPQLQQSIRLLQLSTLELNAEVDRLLQENPLLEREEGEDEVPPQEFPVAGTAPAPAPAVPAPRCGGRAARRSSSRTPRMPRKPLIRARPMKRPGKSRSSAATSSLETPKGTERTMPSFSSLATYSASSAAGRASPPAAREPLSAASRPGTAAARCRHAA